MSGRTVILGLVVLCFCSSAALAGFDHDEAIDGELSGDGMAPTVLTPTPGENYLTGHVGGEDPAAHSDFIQLTVPEGQVLESITVLGYSSDANMSFIGIEDEPVYATEQGNPNYFGYVFFGQGAIGDDALPPMGVSNGNFSPPLYPGVYSFWINESGFAIGYSFTFYFRELGDMNCDGELNAFDIDPFVLATSSPDAYELAYPSCNAAYADLNDDGEVNAFDIDPFVALLVANG